MHARTNQPTILYIIVALLVACGVHGSSSADSTSQAAHAAAATADRKLLVKILPNEQPQTVPFDSHLQLRSPDIKQSDARIVKQAPGCTVPEQVGPCLWQQQQHQQWRPQQLVWVIHRRTE
jgi:hypothetical protein